MSNKRFVAKRPERVEEMGITAGMKEIINFKADRISGAPGIGNYLLRLTTEITMPAWDEEVDVHFGNVIAKVFIGHRLIGFAIPESQVTFKPGKYAHQTWMHFEVLLSYQAIEEIEKIRGGNGLELKLQINGEVLYPRNLVQGTQEVIFRANQASWIEVLKQMGYGTALLLELPVDIALEDELQKSLTYITRARHHLLYGHYNEVVAECRQALEFLLPAKAELKKIRNAAQADHTEMKKTDRLVYFLDALNSFTQLSHHPENSGNRASFTREEAVLVLGTTASALSSESESRKARPIAEAA